MNIKAAEDALREARPSFYRYPNPVVVYWHWTAGGHYTSFRDYHFCIDGDGEIICSRPLDTIPTATWHRNTGSIAIALCCCKGATAYRDPWRANLGDEPPTDAQIESLAMISAAIADVFDIPVDVDHFMTHAEAANFDGYGPDTTCERWDLAVLHDGDEWMSGGDILRGKTAFYLDQECG